MVMQETGSQMIDTMEVGSITTLKFFVESGLGIAFIPKIIDEPTARGTTVRMTSGSLINMTLGIMCKASASSLQSASQKLYQYIKQHLNEPSV